jgi:hypothetical protein
MYQLLMFIGLGLLYAVLKVYLEKRLAPMDTVGDEHQLIESAFANDCSVYELFKRAGTTWNYAPAKIEEDFKQYLIQGDEPHYVRDFVRRSSGAKNRTYHKLLFAGGRPPYI